MAKHVGDQLIDETTGEVLGEDWSEARLIPLLAVLHGLKRDKGRLERKIEKLEKPVRDYLAKHPGEALRDGEHGITARLQFRQGSEEMDVLSLAERNPALLTWAAERGLLRLNAKAYKALQGQGSEMLALKGWVNRPGGTEALVIEEDEKS